MALEGSQAFPAARGVFNCTKSCKVFSRGLQGGAALLFKMLTQNESEVSKTKCSV
jgi:hypothetical protein